MLSCNSKGYCATSHTKHIDITYKYVSEYVEDRIVEIVSVKLGKNHSDILTKNLNEELQADHTTKMTGERQNCFQDLEISKHKRKCFNDVILTLDKVIIIR